MAMVQQKHGPVQDVSAVRRSIDSFLLSLPLDGSDGDAAVEEAVGKRLLQSEMRSLNLRKQLSQWFFPALPSPALPCPPLASRPLPSALAPPP